MAGVGEIAFALGCGENVAVVTIGKGIIGQTFNNDGRFLLVDDAGRFGNKVLWVLPELLEYRLLDAGKYLGDGFAGQMGVFETLAQQVVFDYGMDRAAGFHRRFNDLKGLAIFQPADRFEWCIKAERPLVFHV